MKIKIYKHKSAHHTLFFIEMNENWFFYTARWYGEKYPWDNQWRHMARSTVMCIDDVRYLISAGNKMEMELSSPVEFLVLTGKELQRSIEMELG